MEKDLKRKACRGDIVRYHGKDYFYQPHGQLAYLYLEKIDIGVLEKSVASISPVLVTLVKSHQLIDPRDEENIKVGKLIPTRKGLSYDDVENEDTKNETEIEFLKILVFDLSDRVMILEKSLSDLKFKT
jgi:hypothetical protein